MVHKLVVVDDAPFVKEVVRHLVAQTSFMEIVGEASGGVEALEVIRNTIPDVVLMDAVMPYMNGLEALQLIVEEFPGLRIIIYSSLDEFMIRSQTQIKNYFFLAKPFSKESFLEVLHKSTEIQ